VLGTTSVIKPINYSTEFNSSLVILFLITSLIFIFDKLPDKSKIGGRKGFTMLLIYIEYITMLVGNS
jgi:Ca2+/Na+ antiporter